MLILSRWFILLVLLMMPTLVSASVSDSLKSLIGGGDSGSKDSGNMTPSDFERMAMQIREKAIPHGKYSHSTCHWVWEISMAPEYHDHHFLDRGTADGPQSCSQ